ncbi:MAG: hypothetical protein AAGJ18_27895, partial [Bacteroidota bacterium]
NRKDFLLNPIFVAGLILLVLNDHLWKHQYGNWLTGKLSDFAGLLILPLFLAFIFPRRAKYTAIFSGLFLIFWKSPLSENAIYWYNKVAIIPISRVVDYTGLIALSILPLAHWLIKNIHRFSMPKVRQFRPLSTLVFSITCMAFMATTPPPSYYYQLHDTPIRVNSKYLVNLTSAEILNTFVDEKIVVAKDTFARRHFYRSYHPIVQQSRYPYFKIE